MTAGAISRELDVVARALPLLCRLQTLLPKSSHLTSLIATGIRGSIPLGHDGYLPDRQFSDWNIASLIPSASKRWALRVQPAPPFSISSVLAAATLSDSDIDIVANLLYRNSLARHTVGEWFASPTSHDYRTAHLVRLIFAFYDSVRPDEPKADVAGSHLPRLAKVVCEARHPRQICMMATDCIISIVASSVSGRNKNLKLLSKEFSSLNVDKLSPYPLNVGKGLISRIGSEALQMTEELLDSGLKWAVRHFAGRGSSTDVDQLMLSNMGALHLWLLVVHCVLLKLNFQRR